MTVIRSGYRITCSSWENDWDNHNTKTIDGLTEDEAAFICDVLTHFKSHHSGKNMWGNMYEPKDDKIAGFVEAMNEVIERHPCAKKYLSIENFDDMSEDEIAECQVESLRDFLYDMWGGGEFFTRVVESIRVEYIPETITLDDVSEIFVKNSAFINPETN